MIFFPRGAGHVLADSPSTRPSEWSCSPADPRFDNLLSAELEHPRLGTYAIISALIDTMLLYILRAWLDEQPTSAGTGWAAALRDPYVSAALQAIHRDVTRPWTVASLAAEAGLSRAPFARRFASPSGRRLRRVRRMGEVVVRAATEADVPGWLESSAALFAEDAGTRDPTMNVRWPYELGVAGYAETLAKPDRLVLVAEAGGEIVGHLSGVLGEPTPMRPIRVATLQSLYVRPAYRSHGVGADFVAAFREWATANQAERIAVTAFAANEAAVRFYQRQGFEPMTLTLETTP